METIDSSIGSAALHVHYVPGFRAFQEGPAITAAFEKLRTTPDLILWEGHGIAHPRHSGLASHMGLLLNIPGSLRADSGRCRPISGNVARGRATAAKIVYSAGGSSGPLVAPYTVRGDTFFPYPPRTWSKNWKPLAGGQGPSAMMPDGKRFIGITSASQPNGEPQTHIIAVCCISGFEMQQLPMKQLPTKS